MTNNTPIYGFTIPSEDGTDLWDADLWRTPFTQIDTKLKDRYDTALAMLNGSGAVDLTATDVGCVAAANFTLTSFHAMYRGGLCSMYIQLTRTTSAITVASDGNLANIVMATFVPANPKSKYIIPTCGNAPLNTCVLGTMLQGYILSGGTIGLGAGAPGGSVAVNDQLGFAGTWAVNV